MMKLILAVMCLAAVSFAFTPTYTLCSGPDALMKDFKMTFDPADLMEGQNATVHLSGEVLKKIDDAEITVSVTYEGYPVVEKTIDICKEALKSGAPGSADACPISAGKFDETHTFVVPKMGIHGRIGVNLKIYEVPTGKEIMCAKFTAEL